MHYARQKCRQQGWIGCTTFKDRMAGNLTPALGGQRSCYVAGANKAYLLAYLFVHRRIMREFRSVVRAIHVQYLSLVLRSWDTVVHFLKLIYIFYKIKTNNIQ